MAKRKSTKSPKPQRLPGTEDGAIEELEHAAIEYADIRDQRMNLTTEEAGLKQKVQRLMHKHKQTHYKRGNIEIDLVPEAENVKVKVKKAAKENEQ